MKESSSASRLDIPDNRDTEDAPAPLFSLSPQLSQPPTVDNDPVFPEEEMVFDPPVSSTISYSKMMSVEDEQKTSSKFKNSALPYKVKTKAELKEYGDARTAEKTVSDSKTVEKHKASSKHTQNKLSINKDKVKLSKHTHSKVKSASKTHDIAKPVIKASDKVKLATKTHDQTKTSDKVKSVTQTHDNVKLATQIHDKVKLLRQTKTSDKANYEAKTHYKSKLATKSHGKAHVKVKSDISVTKTHDKESLVAKTDDKTKSVTKTHDKDRLVTKTDDKTKSGTKNDDKVKFGTKTYQKDGSVIKTQGKAMSGTKTYDKDRSLTKTHDKAKLCTQKNDEVTLSTQTHDKVKLSTQTHDKIKLSTQTHDQIKLSTQTHDQVKLSTQTHDKAKSSTHDKVKSGTQIHEKVKLAAKTHDELNQVKSETRTHDKVKRIQQTFRKEDKVSSKFNEKEELSKNIGDQKQNNEGNLPKQINKDRKLSKPTLKECNLFKQTQEDRLPQQTPKFVSKNVNKAKIPTQTRGMEELKSTPHYKFFIPRKPRDRSPVQVKDFSEKHLGNINVNLPKIPKFGSGPDDTQIQESKKFESMDNKIKDTRNNKETDLISSFDKSREASSKHSSSRDAISNQSFDEFQKKEEKKSSSYKIERKDKCLVAQDSRKVMTNYDSRKVDSLKATAFSYGANFKEKSKEYCKDSSKTISKERVEEGLKARSSKQDDNLKEGSKDDYKRSLKSTSHKHYMNVKDPGYSRRILDDELKRKLPKDSKTDSNQFCSRFRHSSPPRRPDAEDTHWKRHKGDSTRNDYQFQDEEKRDKHYNENVHDDVKYERSREKCYDKYERSGDHFNRIDNYEKSGERFKRYDKYERSREEFNRSNNYGRSGEDFNRKYEKREDPFNRRDKHERSKEHFNRNDICERSGEHFNRNQSRRNKDDDQTARNESPHSNEYKMNVSTVEVNINTRESKRSESEYVTPIEVEQEITNTSEKEVFSNYVEDANEMQELPEYDVSKSTLDQLPCKNIFDSHCHLDLMFIKLTASHRFSEGYMLTQLKTFTEFKKHYEIHDKFEGCVTNFCDPKQWNSIQMIPDSINSLAKDEGVYFTVGCHPRHSEALITMKSRDVLERIVKWGKGKGGKCVAIGECGLDLNRNPNKRSAPLEKQISVFKFQLELAIKLDFPLVLHIREAEEKAYKVMEEVGLSSDHPIHRHCFNDSWPVCETWMRKFPGSFIGLTNLLLNPKVQYLHQVARLVPLDRLILETDAPYFSPRAQGRVYPMDLSHPGDVVHVAALVAELRKDTLENVLAANRRNIATLYRIKEKHEEKSQAKGMERKR